MRVPVHTNAAKKKSISKYKDRGLLKGSRKKSTKYNINIKYQIGTKYASNVRRRSGALSGRSLSCEKEKKHRKKKFPIVVEVSQRPGAGGRYVVKAAKYFFGS